MPIFGRALKEIVGTLNAIFTANPARIMFPDIGPDDIDGYYVFKTPPTNLVSLIQQLLSDRVPVIIWVVKKDDVIVATLFLAPKRALSTAPYLSEQAEVVSLGEVAELWNGLYEFTGEWLKVLEQI